MLLVQLVKILKKRFSKFRLSLHRHMLLKEITGGEGLCLEGVINVICPHRLIIGKNVYIGEGAYLNCWGGITIGDNTMISRNVTIYSYNHNFKDASLLPFDKQKVLKPVNIGEYVWIGMNVTIAPGTVIGDGAVIGMGCVVSGNMPENAIVGTEKPRILGYRNHDVTKDLVKREFFLSVSKVDS